METESDNRKRKKKQINKHKQKLRKTSKKRNLKKSSNSSLLFHILKFADINISYSTDKAQGSDQR